MGEEASQEGNGQSGGIWWLWNQDARAWRTDMRAFESLRYFLSENIFMTPSPLEGLRINVGKITGGNDLESEASSRSQQLILLGVSFASSNQTDTPWSKKRCSPNCKTGFEQVVYLEFEKMIGGEHLCDAC